MRNNKTINFKKAMVLKHILKDGTEIKKTIGEKQSSPEELTLKYVELYEPIPYGDLVNLNKKRYRNIKIQNLKNHMYSTLETLKWSIEAYKELINRTEFWEKKSTYDFNLKDWNTLKKANGKLTRYYNDIKSIYQKIESEEI